MAGGRGSYLNHYCPNGHAGVAVREELQVAVLQALASLVVDPSPVGDLIPRFDLATDAGARYPNLIALTLYRDWPQLVQGGLFSCRTLSWREHNTTLSALPPLSLHQRSRSNASPPPPPGDGEVFSDWHEPLSRELAVVRAAPEYGAARSLLEVTETLWALDAGESHSPA